MNTRVFYKVSNFWNPSDEFTLRYDDNKLNIELPFEPIYISEKDKNGKNFDEIPTFDIKL